MTRLENETNKFSSFGTDEDLSKDDTQDMADNWFMAYGEPSKVRPYDCKKYNEL